MGILYVVHHYLYILYTIILKISIKHFQRCYQLAIIRQCTEAVKYIHDRQIMHRDIKSDNVMVGSDGAVKLIDFGVSAKVSM